MTWCCCAFTGYVHAVALMSLVLSPVSRAILAGMWREDKGRAFPAPFAVPLRSLRLNLLPCLQTHSGHRRRGQPEHRTDTTVALPPPSPHSGNSRPDCQHSFLRRLLQQLQSVNRDCPSQSPQWLGHQSGDEMTPRSAQHRARDRHQPAPARSAKSPP
jgi:hypothetical protein